MIRKIISLFILLFVFGITHLHAQNILDVKDATGPAGQVLTMEMEIVNADNFSAFEFTLILPAGFNYVNGTAVLNPDRKGNHQLQVVPSGNNLTIAGFAFPQQNFLLNSGWIVRFDLNTPGVAGQYNLNFAGSPNHPQIYPITPVINILTDASPSVVTLCGIIDPPDADDLTVCFDGSEHSAGAIVPAGYSVVWYTDASGTVTTTAPSATNPGTYKAWAASREDATGCESLTRTEVTLIIHDRPNAPENDGDKSVCANEAIPALTVTVEVGETADWYSEETGGTLLLSGDISYTPTTAGTFYAEARNTTTGCKSTLRTAITLTINPNPVAPESGGDKEICANEEIPALTVTVASDETADWYSEETGGILLLSGDISYTPTAAGTYYAEARNSTTGCKSTSRTAVTLTINDLPEAPTANNVTVFYNGNSHSASANAPIGTTLKWYDAATNGNEIIDISTVLTQTDIGIYKAWAASVTDNTGCESDERTEVTLTINHLPGDANCDGAVNLPDILIVINYLYLDPPGIIPCFPNADMNGNGLVLLQDLLLLINIVYPPQ